MKISWNWLGRHLDLTGLDPNDVGRELTLKMAELDAIHVLGAGIADVTVAQVLSVAKHPSADKLSVVQIFDGTAQHTLVCGAPNAKDAVGKFAAWVPPGSTLPDGTRIERASLRGVESAGMLASEKELGLSDEHGGIVILDQATAGRRFQDERPVRDVVFEIDNKAITHRADLWGHRGVAREVACLFHRKLAPLPLDVVWGTGPAVSVDVRDDALCPRYCAVRFDGVTVGPSPIWLEWLLRAVGQRPRSNVVDLTNFVMLDLGNPIHAFDARQLHGGIIVRRAADGEKVKTLDGVDRLCNADTLLIADHERAVAIAGVMGLENSEIREDTTEVVLEAATFHAENVRKTSSRLGLRTDASARFEKALDQSLPEQAARHFARLLAEVVPGARITSPLADRQRTTPVHHTIVVHPEYIEERLGVHTTRGKVHGTLEPLGFTVYDAPHGALAVEVPSWRATRDIRIVEDLVEEIGRVHGYSNIEPIAPVVAVGAPRIPRAKQQERTVRRALAFGAGMSETMSYGFDSRPFLNKLGAEIGGRVELQNPISSEQDRMRRYLAPNLLMHAERNARQADTIRLFEIGRVFEPRTGPPGTLPHQPRVLGLVVSEAAPSAEAQWQTLRGLVESVLGALGCPDATLARTSVDGDLRAGWLHPARSALVTVGGVEVGYLTLLHPKAARALDLRKPTGVAELDLDLLLAHRAPDHYEPLPRFPAVPFDLAFEVARTVATAELEAAIVRGAEGTPLRSAAWLSSFPLDGGRRSDAYHLVFRADDRSLTTDEVNGWVARIVATVAEFGGTLRA
jgi:phenylalanyl-tRNA synthetase beta chain